MAQAERDYDLNRAAELKYGTLMQLQQRLAGAEAAIKGRHIPGRQSMLREEVTEADISEVISKWTGIPVQVGARGAASRGREGFARGFGEEPGRGYEEV